MEKQLRANVGYRGTPIRLLWRSKKKTEYDGSKEGSKKGAVGVAST
jgi:GTP-binding protein